jgi:uncharacterized membrane protein
MYNVVFFLHILGVLAFVSGVVVAGVAFESARRREDPAEIATLLGLGRVGAAVMGPGVLVAGACGLWLVHLGRWHYDSFWVLCSVALFVLALALGGRGGQRPRQARLLATRIATEGGQRTDELAALLNDRAALAQNYASLLLVLAIIAIMCFKP